MVFDILPHIALRLASILITANAGYESAGDMDFPNAPKNEPTQEPDRLFNGIYIPHTIEWKIPPHRRSEAETDLSSGRATETEDDIED